MDFAVADTEEDIVAVNPSGRDYWFYQSMFKRGGDGLPIPSFPVDVTAQVFFGRTGHWLRYRSRPTEDCPQGIFTIDGEPIEPERSAAGNRRYSLADIERMAHALAIHGKIDPTRLVQIIMVIKAVGRLYGIKV